MPLKKQDFQLSNDVLEEYSLDVESDFEDDIEKIVLEGTPLKNHENTLNASNITTSFGDLPTSNVQTASNISTPSGKHHRRSSTLQRSTGAGDLPAFQLVQQLPNNTTPSPIKQPSPENHNTPGTTPINRKHNGNGINGIGSNINLSETLKNEMNSLKNFLASEMTVIQTKMDNLSNRVDNIERNYGKFQKEMEVEFDQIRKEKIKEHDEKLKSVDKKFNFVDKNLDNLNFFKERFSQDLKKIDDQIDFLDDNIKDLQTKVIKPKRIETVKYYFWMLVQYFVLGVIWHVKFCISLGDDVLSVLTFRFLWGKNADVDMAFNSTQLTSLVDEYMNSSSLTKKKITDSINSSMVR
eukprot:TRINITY_DN1459_c0_g1_i1.p1 TRINITY_DN1459_c0_g1~~TRINITY_DN1459_c0_g1_i1.p1  ORF type:complete len:352 (+),score=120.34 TRINITY_DN1459_c0_g1_i1:38-1093(+)